MRILIAEDDEALARFVRQGLENEHYTVDVVADGECHHGVLRGVGVRFFGMPKVCSELGALSRMVPLFDIPRQIIQATRQRKPT